MVIEWLSCSKLLFPYGEIARKQTDGKIDGAAQTGQKQKFYKQLTQK